MRTITASCAVLILLACSPTELDDRWARPEAISFAPSLNIDLASMNRTSTGLYWQDLEAGSGLAAEVGHRVFIHYQEWLPDGTLIDSTYELNRMLDYVVGVGGVIRGLDEGVVGMQLGGRRKLVVPPHLGWGRRGNGPIPPLATLVFEIELVSIRL